MTKETETFKGIYYNGQLGTYRSEYRDIMLGMFVTYMQSEDWKRLKSIVFERDNHRCVECNEGTNKLVCHHKDYDNWGKGNNEERDDCITVCSRCHGILHNKMKNIVPFWAKQGYDGEYFDTTRPEQRRLMSAMVNMAMART